MDKHMEARLQEIRERRFRLENRLKLREARKTQRCLLHTRTLERQLAIIRSENKRAKDRNLNYLKYPESLTIPSSKISLNLDYLLPKSRNPCHIGSGQPWKLEKSLSIESIGSIDIRPKDWNFLTVDKSCSSPPLMKAISFGELDDAFEAEPSSSFKIVLATLPEDEESLRPPSNQLSESLSCEELVAQKSQHPYTDLLAIRNNSQETLESSQEFNDLKMNIIPNRGHNSLSLVDD